MVHQGMYAGLLKELSLLSIKAELDWQLLHVHVSAETLHLLPERGIL